jgi:hypothetical protein
MAALLSFSMALPAFAQSQTRKTEHVASPVPAPGMIAAGVSTGFAIPTEPALDNGMGLAVNAERYFTSRLSARGQLSGAWTNVFGPVNSTVSPMVVSGNLVYNWEGGKWHPFVSGGLGFYHYRFNEASVFSTSNKLGVEVGGGTEFFLTRHDSVSGEVVAHVVPGQVVSTFSSYDPTYWSIGAGYKKYFGR